MNYRLLVVDIDGTLLGGSREISAGDREALAKARALGVEVSLSTGRVPRACADIIDQLSLDGYHIFADGASVSNPAGVDEIYVQSLDWEVVKEMVGVAHRHEIPLELYSATDYFAEQETWSTEIHRHFFGISPTVVDLARLDERERIIKVGVVTTSAGEVARAEGFCRHFGGRLHFSWARTPAYPGVDFINILAPEVSKGKALEALTSHLRIPMDEVIAIGDGTNDISLLSTAGLAVAMANALDDVKAVADHVTLDVDHSGVAAAIKKFLLSPESG